MPDNHSPWQSPLRHIAQNTIDQLQTIMGGSTEEDLPASFLQCLQNWAEVWKRLVLPTLPASPKPSAPQMPLLVEGDIITAKQIGEDLDCVLTGSFRLFKSRAWLVPVGKDYDLKTYQAHREEIVAYLQQRAETRKLKTGGRGGKSLFTESQNV